MNNHDNVIHFVDALISQARNMGVSDIHLEPTEQTWRIRFRQDGLLQEITHITKHLAERVITRLKVMADLDISEHRLPQDGHFKNRHADQALLDVRISTCPQLHGEKLVLRLLDSNKIKPNIDHLGLTPEQKLLFTQSISQAQGLILITGPTGSGKTLTLYSALAEQNQGEKNIVTLEDPIEMQIKGLNQIQINPKAGLDFASALRAILRQDPDIIMLGEIRDRESAEIALQAAQTGHLVLSSLHTNSAAETLSRLLAMGIPAYQLISGLQLIVAQRLLRKLCSQHFDNTEPVYRGRTGIFECLYFNTTLKSQMLQAKDHAQLIELVQNQGYIKLKEAGFLKIQQGETNLQELQRALLL